MSLVALPLMVGSSREALQAVPRTVSEASYALGKSQWVTIRHVLLPSVRPGIATGAALGMGRIIGDTAIAILLLGRHAAQPARQAARGRWTTCAARDRR